MKKKITLVLSLVFVVCMLAACGKTDIKSVEYGDKNYEALLTENATNAMYIAYLAHDKQSFGNIDFSNVTEDTETALLSYGFSEAQIEAVSTWLDVENEYGECTVFDNPQTFTVDAVNPDENFDINKAGSTVTTDLVVKFGERDTVIEVVYDAYNMKVTSISVTPIKTMGEKMTAAGQNTIISLAIVFAVLILISLIISGFKVFAYIEDRKNKKESAATKKDNVETVAAPAQEPVAVTDDTELIAVIAAAIAASEGTSTSDFVVRSINRR